MKTYDEMKEIILDERDESVYYSDEFKQAVIAELGDIVADKPAFAGKILSLAWENGHAYGFGDIFSHLDDLIYLTK